MADLTCVRCQQLIKIDELYHEIRRHTDELSLNDMMAFVHLSPCPTVFEIINGHAIFNGVDLGPIGQVDTSNVTYPGLPEA